MEILRVLNNNVVLARDEIGREAILTGRGLGFQRKRGQDVDASLISRRYIPADNAQSVAEVIAGIPLERLALIERVFRKAARGLNTDVPSSTLIAVVDHINQAMERVCQGLTMDYPLRAEVAHLHPEELRLAEAMVEEINAAQEVQLPGGEAVALALHLFTAAIGAPSAQAASEQSRLIGQVMGLLEKSFGDAFDADSVNAARFAVHLRYFLVRARTAVQIEDGTSSLVAEALRVSDPDAYRVARRIRDLLEIRLNTTVSDDETAYLALHVARLTSSLQQTM
ncbi:sugar transporter [Actinomyces naeslundii]|uniref:PRD domain-containing protein n=1 Tax=Actinomyces naeslundii TaxID=1655 RepID=UPI00094D3DF2|nr:PRD domain-containing protein [Actinomyces naeslundii]OLO93089.1 sugar transporter [Actinomyces naeslundii]